MEKVEKTYFIGRRAPLSFGLVWELGACGRRALRMHQWDVIAPSFVVVVHDPRRYTVIVSRLQSARQSGFSLFVFPFVKLKGARGSGLPRARTPLLTPTII